MFDTEKFICEIEKRPAIYNVKMKEYSNRDIKAKMWEEVTRWKSLRDQFRKEVRAMKTAHSGQSAPKKKKKYVYFDQLLFLLPSLAARVTASNLIDDAITNDADAVEGNDAIQMTTPEEAPLTASSSSRITPTAETGGTRKRPRNARNVY
ncbi:hypothetical protein RI129_002733 [Pyrocoelia pectoralis]|uniref:MADF domain-containing protein n=1 Tax=Pyrocoelia pectoralis TaxID=417401 RepID=A0AAN7ZTK9_9COLE